MVIGSRLWLAKHGYTVDSATEERLKAFENRQATVVLAAMDGHLAAVFTLGVQLKPEAATVVGALLDMGLQVIMLTGDNRRTAKALAEEVGGSLFIQMNTFSQPSVLPWTTAS